MIILSNDAYYVLEYVTNRLIYF